MQNKERFPYSTGNDTHNLPYLPITLNYQGKSIPVSGLLDTGASVNVLPYEIGVQLGAGWELHTTPVELTGNLAHYEARGIILHGVVGPFTPVRLVFAWTKNPNVPVILGQMNFFLEFDVCFFGSQAAFEISPSLKLKH
jgi:hypothetical protein